MAGNRDGGLKSAKKIKKNFGKDFFVKLGAQGAQAYKERQKKGIALPRGFAADRELARNAGIIGGQRSSRLGSPNKPKRRSEVA